MRMLALLLALAPLPAHAQIPGTVAPNQVIAGPPSGVIYGEPSPRALVAADLPAAGAIATPPQMRLTLVSGVPVPTTDQVGVTAHFCTPYPGGSPSATAFVPITTDGINFLMTSVGELTQATVDATKSPAAVANNSVYDVFLWSDSGTIRCTRGRAWTSDTVDGSGAGRGDIDFTTRFPTNKNAITNGPAANRGVLIGAVRSNGAAQFTDSKALRWVSNVYNAVPRYMQVFEATASWNYTTATYRQANANAANQLDFLSALPGNLVTARLVANASNTNVGVILSSGIDIDTLNTTSIVGVLNSPQYTAVAGNILGEAAFYSGYPGVGRHTAIWKEWSQATGTTTWYGTAGGTILQSGIIGEILN